MLRICIGAFRPRLSSCIFVASKACTMSRDTSFSFPEVRDASHHDWVARGLMRVVRTCVFGLTSSDGLMLVKTSCELPRIIVIRHVRALSRSALVIATINAVGRYPVRISLASGVSTSEVSFNPATSTKREPRRGTRAAHGGAIPLGYRYNIQPVCESPVWAAYLTRG
jgi:hypothetical protein